MFKMQQEFFLNLAWKFVRLHVYAYFIFLLNTSNKGVFNPGELYHDVLWYDCCVYVCLLPEKTW